MKKTIAILFIILTQCVLVVNGSTSKVDSLGYEVLLTSKMLGDIHVDDQFISAVDITSNRLVLLATPKRFYLLGWGGIEPLGNEMSGQISSFAFTPDQLLMAIRNSELCAFDSLGSLSKLFSLPSPSMGISAGKNVMYAFDRAKGKQKYSIYLIAKGGTYARLFEVPAPINSVVENNQSILFSTGSLLMSYSMKEKNLKIVATLQKDNEIKSIAMDSLNNRIYLSTENSIYALKDSSLVAISNELGGILRHFNDGLLVFNSEKKLLVRIVGLEDKIASTMEEVKTEAPDKPTVDVLTNATIVDLVKSKLSDELIINLINRSTVDFNVSVDAMIYLSSQNVSSEVIMAMKNAMKRKNNGE